MIDLNRMNILVVDDMKSMRLTIRKMLRHLDLGGSVKTASDCKEALVIMKSSQIDLLILDWRLPNMTGSELLDLIRKDDALKLMPVIMVTAESERDIVMEVAEIQVDGYLLKPLTLEALDKKIRYVVEKANNPDEATIHFRNAKEFENAGNFTEAIEQIKLALKYKPKASRLLRMLGALHLKTGDLDHAEKIFQKAAATNTQDAVTRHMLGEMYHQRGELLKAARYHMEVMALTIKYLEKSINLGERLLKKGQNRAAVQLLSKGIARVERNRQVKERVIDMCIENGEFEYAIELLEGMIKEFPSKYDLVLKAAYAYLEQEDDEKALEYFMLVDKHQGHLVEPKLEIAKLFIRKEKIYQADEYLGKVLFKDPENEAAVAIRQGI